MNASDMAFSLIAVARRLDTAKVAPLMITVSAKTEALNVSIVVIGTKDRGTVTAIFGLKPNDGPDVPATERVLSVGDWQGVHVVVNHIDEKIWAEAMAAS